MNRVGGPGSPGVIVIEGEKVNLRRIYAPPAAPVVPLLPGDRLDYDDNGQLDLVRYEGTTSTGWIDYQHRAAALGYGNPDLLKRVPGLSDKRNR